MVKRRPWPRLSVSRHCRIYLNGPGVNSTDRIFHVRESLLDEIARGIGASHSMMAIGHDLRVTVQLPQGLRQRSQWNELGSLQFG